MAATPVFAATPKYSGASLTTATGAAELGTAAPTNAVLLVTAAANGTYLRRLRAKVRNAAPTAGLLRVFLVNGGVYYLLMEIDLASGAAASATVKSQDTDWVTLDLVIPTGWTVYVAETQANNTTVHCEHADI